MDNAEIRNIIDIYNCCHNITKVAEITHHGALTVKSVLIDNDIPCCLLQERVVVLFEKGYSAQQISDMIGVKLDKIYGVLPSGKHKLKDSD